MRASARRLADGRLHLQDGPIDLIIEAWGETVAVEAAYSAATRRFAGVLDELCAELPILRAPSTASGPAPRGVVARRMSDAVSRFHARRFITPMAAVAGAVAEEIVEAMTRAAPLAKAYVNNGGDIAFHVAPGEAFAIGMIERPDRLAIFGRVTLTGEDGALGIATSGWRGRSFSLGIADAVTVIAPNAALADVAATLIANAVDCPGHCEVKRVPARSRDPQSDLCERLVTLAVGALSADDIDDALGAGVEEAELWRREGFIVAAALRLKGETRLVGPEAAPYPWVASAPLFIETTRVRHAVG